MQRIFNFLLAIVVLLVVFLIGGMFLPEQVRVEQRIHIKASPQRVHAWLMDFHRQQQWLAWKDIDPNIEYQFAGQTKGEGAVMHWRSQHEQIGSGSQKILSQQINRQVKIIMALNRIGKAYAQFYLEDEAGGTSVTWRFEMHFGFNIIGRFRGLSLIDEVDGQYRQGLDNLKIIIEQGDG